MYKKINRQNVISNTHGAVIIEFIYITFIIIILIKILIFTSEHYSTIGKLDRISYSLSGMIRERTRLYGGDSKLTEEQVSQLRVLANKMLSNSGLSESNVAITVETIHFNPTQSSEVEHKVINDTKSLSFSIGSCEPDKPLKALTQLSPFSNAGRWIPLYQVTLCLPASTWYNALFNQGGNTNYIKSSSMTIER
ncbi:tight adherence pilus pseudopilin TadF [Yersinia proxima]|uniref:Tight adherence pilus pseudopilin TadF n=1 Tax=Yersinia proxima TaxID=2890316 RepID=A0ABW9EXR7_9GAMM|nr:tight adherence pilus pseudopilin TadF [Yersinia proxima]CNL31358.1 putative tight adherance operon protein [Yersinia intermedia]